MPLVIASIPERASSLPEVFYNAGGSLGGTRVTSAHKLGISRIGESQRTDCDAFCTCLKILVSVVRFHPLAAKIW